MSSFSSVFKLLSQCWCQEKQAEINSLQNIHRVSFQVLFGKSKKDKILVLHADFNAFKQFIFFNF